jgi:hypothetical protein
MKKIVQEGPFKADTIQGKHWFATGVLPKRDNNFTRRWMITKGSSCGATEVEARKFREMVDGSLV